MHGSTYQRARSLDKLDALVITTRDKTFLSKVELKLFERCFSQESG